MKKQPESTEKRLRDTIQRELMRCDRDVTPAICAKTSTKEGYHFVEQTIIDMVISQGITPSACVAQLEMEWSTK